MAAYSLSAGSTSQTTPTLAKGPVRIITPVSIYWCVGQNPVANKNTCAILPAGQNLVLRLPVKCSKIAVLAVKEPGMVNVVEEFGGGSSSCSA